LPILQDKTILTLDIIVRVKNPRGIATEHGSRGLRLFIFAIFVVLNSSQNLDLKTKLISTFILGCVKSVALHLLNTGFCCLSHLLSSAHFQISSG